MSNSWYLRNKDLIAKEIGEQKLDNIRQSISCYFVNNKIIRTDKIHGYKQRVMTIPNIKRPGEIILIFIIKINFGSSYTLAFKEFIN